MPVEIYHYEMSILHQTFQNNNNSTQTVHISAKANSDRIRSPDPKFG